MKGDRINGFADQVPNRARHARRFASRRRKQNKIQHPFHPPFLPQRTHALDSLVELYLYDAMKISPK